MAAEDIERLWRVALTLKPRRPLRKGLPPLLFLTDPGRTPDPCAIAERLPSGAGVVYRAFGAADALAMSRRLGALCRRRGLTLLIGADARLARAAGAAGVHLPQRLAGQARRLKGRGLVTAAAHDLASARAAVRAGADAVLLSTAFASASPSAGKPLGPVRFAMLARRIPAPVYALGGVNARTARRLMRSGAAGLAAVGAFRT